VEHPQVAPDEHHRDRHEEGESSQGGPEEATAEGGPPAPEPHRPDRGADREQVQELQPEREAEAHLPGGDREAGHEKPRHAPPVASQQQEQAEQYAAARDHVQVAVLLELPRGEGERHAGYHRGRPAEPGLAGEKVGAGEGEA
jgi:hypothetical protein